MKLVFRNIGAAAVVALALATAAEAQQTRTSSSKRIPVRKAPNADSLAAAERARQDSIALAARERARLDSIAMAERERARLDSIALAEAERRRLDSLSRVSTVSTGAVELEQPTMRLGNWYFSLGGGASVPARDASDWMRTGFNVTGSLGYEPVGSPLGLRFDVGYDRLMGRRIPGGTAPGGTDSRFDDAAVWSGLANATLRMPLGTSTWRPALYLIGGGGVHYFSDWNDLRVAAGGTVGEVGERSSTDFGVNGGAGLSFGLGRADLFVESRYFHVFTEGQATNYVPVVLGFKFR